MAFFSQQNRSSQPIEIDSTTANSGSPEMQRRLQRIEQNYQQLDVVLAELEEKFSADDRLRAIDDANCDFEAEFGIKRKRKWRASKKSTGAKKRRSAGPNKPR